MEVEWFKIDTRFFSALPIMVFAFSCHMNVC